MIMLPILSLLVTFCIFNTDAVLNGKEIKRREAFDTYGPPRPAPQYGPPPQISQHIPHREYGVPQQIPFREYGPPSIKYTSPQLNFLSHGGSSSSSSFGGGLHEQIKSHFGVPKPFYGPPHIQHKPSQQYGPPPSQQYGPPPSQQYGPPPSQQYGPPPSHPKPIYGAPPPSKQQHRPLSIYGPPKLQNGPPLQPQLPSHHPAPIFKPAHQPATSYGPPASGPLNLPTKPIYDVPPPNYGPPPLPINLPSQQPAHFNRGPESTIIINEAGGNYGGQHFNNGPQKQVQIQIDSAGHTHSVSGSQAPFHTACDGWKPIPAPVDAYIEHNNIDTQSGYSQVTQAASSTQYNSGSGGSGGSIVNGLSDEQLVAIALQDGFGGNNNQNVNVQLASTHDNNKQVNSIESEALQLSLGSLDDSYSRPPSDSYAPGSVHANNYNTIRNGPPLPPPPGNYLPPSGNFGPHNGPVASALVQPQSQQFNSHSQFGFRYGVPSGNIRPFPQQGGIQSNRPVSYRPPVPKGLLESIGAAVEHLDQFGVKPPQQSSTYIPPAANDIAQHGPELSPNPPFYAPPSIIEQQLPQPQQPQIFVQQNLQSLQHANIQNEYGLPPPPQVPLPQQYLPPPSGSLVGHSQQYSENSYSASKHSQQVVSTQGHPLQVQEPRLNLQQQLPQQQQISVHNCGQGPNLIGVNGYQAIDAQNNIFGDNTAYNSIAQSNPIAEQHTQFITGQADSYGPPASGDIDHVGYASQKSSVTALPEGSNTQDLPGLEGLNVISAQKSQSIQLTDNQDNTQQKQTFQVQFGSSLNNNNSDNGNEGVLSQDLLQSILTAIEDPYQREQLQDLPQNHKAQNRSDNDVNKESDDDIPEDPNTDEVQKVKTEESDDKVEEEAFVKELKPIVAKEVNEED